MSEGVVSEAVALPDESSKLMAHDAVGGTAVGNDKLGIMHPKALVFLGLWYIFSSLTLFLNKYIVDIKDGDTALLGICQMVTITLGGAVNMYLPCGLYIPSKAKPKPSNFYKNMIIIGIFRFMTVILGLVALKFVAVSFTETVKSSAPMFTVLIAKVMLGENTSPMVLCSLLPIMGGLALTSAYEISFNLAGLLAALGTNITECPAEMQFYTSLGSMIIFVPAAFLVVDFEKVQVTMTAEMFISLILNGVFFHGQTITAYSLMGYISPVTHSVANTVKRALMICLSVFIFGNEVTVLAGVGMVLVTVGVFIYNKARERESALKEIADKYP